MPRTYVNYIVVISQIKEHLLDLGNSYVCNYKPSPRILRQHRVLRKVRKNKVIVETKPNKGNGVAILDQKLFDTANQEIISDTSKFGKLNEDPTFKSEASLPHFLCKLKQKNFFNETEYDKLCLSGSVPDGVYGTPKMHKFSPSDLFFKLLRLFQLQVLLVIILPVSFVIFFHL